MPANRAAVVLGIVLSLAGASAAAAPTSDKLGQKIDSATLTGAGKPVAAADLKDKKAVVVVFLSFDCPVSNSYAQTLAEMARNYGPRGVAFVGVVPTDDTAAEVARQAKDFKIPFPVFKDEKFATVDAFKAEFTPEAFVLDANLILRYRGRIDDAYAARLKKNQKITKQDLKRALDEVLAGKPVSVAATEPIGCTISKSDITASAKPQSSSVTFYRDVLPILQNQCQVCHRPGEVGPFSLMTYRQAVNWAGDIKEFTQSKKMPPWKPIDGPGFLHERKLSDKEIAVLAAWVDGGTPEGDPKDAPPPRQFVKGWQLGQPDLVLTVPEDFQLGPSGNDLFRCYVLPTNLPEDKYVTAIEVRPGNPRIVHHTLNFIDVTGQARDLEAKEKQREHKPDDLDGGPGYSTSMGIGFLPRGALGGWAPGQMPRHLPEGTGYFLPKGADVVLQVHYHRDGRLEKDRTAIGLHFAKKPVQHRYLGMVVAGGGVGAGRVRWFAIPAGNDHFTLKGSIWVEQDCTLYSVMPHMHMIGKEISVAMTPPDGPARTLVAIKDWDYNWQETYFFKEPIPVKAGTRFDIEAVYDNSAANPNNPNKPPRLVTFGQQTTNEMCFGFLGATSDLPGQRIRFTATNPAKKAADKPDGTKKS